MHTVPWYLKVGQPQSPQAVAQGGPVTSIGAYTDACPDCIMLTSKKLWVCTICREDVCETHLPAHHRKCREKMDLHNKAQIAAENLDEE